jgi:hypothetical protein
MIILIQFNEVTHGPDWPIYSLYAALDSYWQLLIPNIKSDYYTLTIVEHMVQMDEEITPVKLIVAFCLTTWKYIGILHEELIKKIIPNRYVPCKFRLNVMECH